MPQGNQGLSRKNSLGEKHVGKTFRGVAYGAIPISAHQVLDAIFVIRQPCVRSKTDYIDNPIAI